MPLLAPRRVEREKLVAYLLNKDHQRGHGKAKFFFSCGFSLDHAGVFERALLAHAAENDIFETTQDEFGEKTVVKCSTKTPDGNTPCILTVWRLDLGRAPYRLITAYPNDPTQ